MTTTIDLSPALAPLWRRITLAGVVYGVLMLAPLVAGGQVEDGQSSATRAGETRVEPGDRVIVHIAREPLLGDTVTVGSQGDIVLAKIGTVHATSMTIRALEDTVRARYGAVLRNPAVAVKVMRRIVVNGEVGKPGVYYVDVAQTLRDVIALAGGITDLGAESSVAIIRRGERVAVPQWHDDFSLASDLRSGDEIFVGKRSWLARNAVSVASTALVFVSLLITVVRR